LPRLLSSTRTPTFQPSDRSCCIQQLPRQLSAMGIALNRPRAWRTTGWRACWHTMAHDRLEEASSPTNPPPIPLLTPDEILLHGLEHLALFSIPTEDARQSFRLVLTQLPSRCCYAPHYDNS
jgi:hypothetical protein